MLRSPRRLTRAGRVVVWTGTALSEHLLLAFLPQLLRLLGGDHRTLHLVEYDDRVPGERLNDIAKRAKPRRLTRDELDDLDEVWRAVTDPTPEALLLVLDQETSPMPRTQRALRSLLAQYPDAVSGLSVADRTLLENTRDHGPVAARVIGHALVALDDLGHRVGDLTLFDRVLRMARCERPALSVSGPDTTHMRRTEVRLTEVGHEILGGHANFIALNGIEECVAGVRLSSKTGSIWLVEGGRLVRRTAV